MPPLTPEQIAERGHAAATLLNNETFCTIMNEMLAHCYGQWLATNEREVREREELHMRVRAVEGIRDELKERVDAAKKMAADTKRAERRKREI